MKNVSSLIVARSYLLMPLRNIWVCLVVAGFFAILYIIGIRTQDDTSAIFLIGCIGVMVPLFRGMLWYFLYGSVKVRLEDNVVSIEGGWRRKILLTRDDVNEVDVEYGDGFPELSRWADFAQLRISVPGRRIITRRIMLSRLQVDSLRASLRNWHEDSSGTRVNIRG